MRIKLLSLKERRAINWRLNHEYPCADCGQPVSETKTFCDKCSDRRKIKNMTIMMKKGKTYAI